MATIIPPKAPNLPAAPTEYQQTYIDQLLGMLRLYFSAVDNASAATVTATTTPTTPTTPTSLTASSVVNVPAGNIAAVDVQAALNELDTEKVPRTSTTGSAVLPVGTTAQRDGGTPTGYLRYNSTLSQFEGYGSAGWGKVGGGATGGGTDSTFYENDQTITTNYTLTTNKNAMTAGPITIADGITVTIPTGATWSIV